MGTRIGTGRERGRDRGERSRGKEAQETVQELQTRSGTFSLSASSSGIAVADTLQLHSQGLVPVHTHRTEEVTGSEEREGANGVEDGIRVGGGIGDENEDGSGDGAGTGTGTRVETRGRMQYRNGDGSGDGNVSSSGDEKGNEGGNGNGNKNTIGEGGREAKKRKKPHKTCRRHVGNGGDLGGKRKKCRT